MIGAQEIFNVS